MQNVKPMLKHFKFGIFFFFLFPTGNSLGRNPTKLSGLKMFTWKKLVSLTTLLGMRCARRFAPLTLLALLLPKDPDVQSTSKILATLGKDCRSGSTTADCQWSLPEPEPSLSQPFPWCFQLGRTAPCLTVRGDVHATYDFYILTYTVVPFPPANSFLQ